MMTLVVANKMIMTNDQMNMKIHLILIFPFQGLSIYLKTYIFTTCSKKFYPF